jgi:hypothetical protein
MKKSNIVVSFVLLFMGFLQFNLLAAPSKNACIKKLQALTLLPNYQTNADVKTVKLNLIRIFNDSIGKYCEPLDEYKVDTLSQTLALSIVDDFRTNANLTTIVTHLCMLRSSLNSKKQCAILIGNSGITISVQDMVSNYLDLLAITYLYLAYISEDATSQTDIENLHAVITNHDLLQRHETIMLAIGYLHLFVDIQEHLSTLELI